MTLPLKDAAITDLPLMNHRLTSDVHSSTLSNGRAFNKLSMKCEGFNSLDDSLKRNIQNIFSTSKIRGGFSLPKLSKAFEENQSARDSK